MTDECSMTEDCPGFDKERGVCLLRPEDCEFAAALEAATRPEARAVSMPAAPTQPRRD